ncbi:MAG: hypothetical protein HRU41_15535 [Saprospiraceae bacterium]|nr:hypothetical protein [Saprospiraceae bacterium]
MKVFQFALTLVCCLLVAGISAQTASTSCSPEKVAACKAKADKSATAVSLAKQADCSKTDPCCDPCPPGCCKVMTATAAAMANVAQVVLASQNSAAQKTAKSPNCKPLSCQPAQCKPDANKAKAKTVVAAKL